jgi:hypothetical protein
VPGVSSRGVNLITYLYGVPRSKEVGLYLYFQTHLHDVEHFKKENQTVRGMQVQRELQNMYGEEIFS